MHSNGSARMAEAQSHSETLEIDPAHSSGVYITQKRLYISAYLLAAILGWSCVLMK